MATRLVQIAMNARDDSALGRFWAEALGWGVASEEPGVTNSNPWASPIPTPSPSCIDVLRVPEPKTVKNRVHIDLATTSAAHQADLVARLQRSRRDARRRGPGRRPVDGPRRPGRQRVLRAGAPAGLPGHRADRRGGGRLRGSAGHGPVLGRGDGLDPARGDRRSCGAALRQGCRPVSGVPPHART